MEHTGEKFVATIESTVKQQPFKNEAVRNFFTKWCEINDSIRPKYTTREEWDQSVKEKGLLQKRDDGKKDFLIPEDLQIWELVPMIQAVDRDTFGTDNDRSREATEKMLNLGEVFKASAIYIANRISVIGEGRDIAEGLIGQFYAYGESLKTGKKVETPNVEELSKIELTKEGTEYLDRFLLGDKLYESRKKKVENNLKDKTGVNKNEYYESERQKTLAQFFRVTEKALELQKKEDDGVLSKSANKLDKPWQDKTPVHGVFLKNVKGSIIKEIETPKQELKSSIFRRGMEFLRKNMPFDKLPDELKNDLLHWENGEKTLREALQIDRLKKELGELRSKGNIKEIVTKEREIVDNIQWAILNFTYDQSLYNPSEILATQSLNCIGASTLGGALMSEVGLNYLVGNIPRHSILFLITSDGNVEWRDMLDNVSNESLTDNMISEQNSDGTHTTLADIVAFSKSPTPEGLMFNLKTPEFDNMVLTKEGEGNHISVFGPEYGQMIQVLNTTGQVFFTLAKEENDLTKKYDYYLQSVETYKRAIFYNPKQAYSYNGLGLALLGLGRSEEAIEVYRQAIAIDQKYANSYFSLGNALANLGRNDEAIAVYERLVEMSGSENTALVNKAKGIVRKLKTEI